MQRELGLKVTLSRKDVSAWVGGYEQAWRSAGTEPLRDLFSEEASYRMSPYEEPARGLTAIASLWDREREGPDEEFTMTHEVVALEGYTAVVRVEVQYGGPDRLEYRDLWVLRFAANGLCCELEEWPFWPGQQIIAERRQL